MEVSFPVVQRGFLIVFPPLSEVYAGFIPGFQPMDQ
jgi:hypothetical protein